MSPKAARLKTEGLIASLPMYVDDENLRLTLHGNLEEAIAAAKRAVNPSTPMIVVTLSTVAEVTQAQYPDPVVSVLGERAPAITQ